MNILGVGGAEFVLVIVIMLVVAGPKRMIRWMYILGIYTAKARRMWEETVFYLQKEIDDAGVDLQLPKEPPTRGSLNTQFKNTVNKAVAPITRPVQESLKEVEKVSSMVATGENGRKTEPKPDPQPPAPESKFGTWSDSQPKQDGDSAS